MLKFDKENMEAEMLKYIIMNCSCEFLSHNNKFYINLKIRLGTINSNTVNSKFLWNFGKNPIISCLKWTVNSNTVNLNFHQFEVNLTGI